MTSTGPASAALAPVAVDQWIETALEMLAEGGVSAVRVEPLALRLGVTKGAFYPRFANRDALLAALLDYWRRVSTVDVLDVMAAIDESPADRFQRLLDYPIRRPDTRDRARIEMAIRIWSKTDPRAEATMREIDAIRIRYIEGVLKLNGFPDDEISARARIIFGYIVVDGVLPARSSADERRIMHRLLSDGIAQGPAD